MGSVISNAANGFGNVVGNAITAPFKTIFSVSCEDVCSGPWDVICFIEHLCVANLAKLLMILCLCYIILMFFYLLFKLGIFQCIGRGLCKVCWASCETYWSALGDITGFFWHKLKNTKRVNRRRFRDIENGYNWGSETESDISVDYHHHSSVGRKRKSSRERRKLCLRSSLYPSSHHSRRSHHHHHHVRLKTREVSVHVKGGLRRPRNSRHFQLVKVRNPRRDIGLFKRRRLR